MTDFDRESMLEMFIFEMTQLIDQLESTIVQSESEYNMDQINEIFRVMHTIKGSSAMMMYDNIASVAHSIEDLFYYLREENPEGLDFKRLSDHVLSGADFVKEELAKLQNGEKSNGDGTELALAIDKFLHQIKGEEIVGKGSAPEDESPSAKPQKTVAAGENMHKYKAKIFFQDGCEMENIRAYTLVHNLQEFATDITHVPSDVIDESTIPLIRNDGFIVEFSSSRDYNFVYNH